LGIKEETRYLRKEIEIVVFIQEMLTQVMIPFEFQKSVANYRIDLYLPSLKLAIEIDENNHADRDPSYEQARQERIQEELGCWFRLGGL
jgi:very-short-patch-repair endonuclease